MPTTVLASVDKGKPSCVNITSLSTGALFTFLSCSIIKLVFSANNFCILPEAGSTDLEKFEVGANLLIRSVHYGNIPIAEVLAMPNQYEAIFNPMGRVPGLKPYTAEDLAGTPDFIKLGKLLRVSPKRASTLYYRHRAQFFSQLKIEE